ncbi:MAG TPA: hypothetical protein VF950_21120 [Planctomycetota bacterium]
MSALAAALLRGPAADLPAARVLLLSAASSAAFGAAIGAYTGGRQILYAAVKMPLYFHATLALSFAALHLFAARELRARDTFQAALEAVALTTLVLAALAPVVLLAALSCPPRRYTALVLLLVASVAAGGAAAVARLRARLRRPGLTAAWIVLYQFVGAQMAWLLKPWVGYSGRDDRFLPLRENLQGNFYESVFGILASLFT